MAEWSFLTNHARVLVCIAHDPGARLRDIAAELGLTERTVFGIVTDLAATGYLTKERDGRRNRYEVEAHMPLREARTRSSSIGELLAIVLGPEASQPGGAATVGAKSPSPRKPVAKSVRGA